MIHFHLLSLAPTYLLLYTLNLSHTHSSYRSGLKVLPNNAKMHYNYANFLRDTANYKLAKYHYRKALILWPNYASAWNNLGTLIEDIDAQELHFLNAIHYSNEHINAHFNLGQLYRYVLYVCPVIVLTCKQQSMTAHEYLNNIVLFLSLSLTLSLSLSLSCPLSFPFAVINLGKPIEATIRFRCLKSAFDGTQHLFRLILDYQRCELAQSMLEYCSKKL